MAAVNADLIYDPNDIGSDCVVRCRISNGPRDDDASFNPTIGDHVTLIDDDGEVLRGRVTARDADRVWVQTDIQSRRALTA
ncbi:MAG: hypothetical protein ACK4V6_05635 [Microthrixaceae bacterium]